MNDHYRKLESMYAGAPINQFYHPDTTIEDSKATIVITTAEKHFHAAGAAHGSIYFKMLDDAAFFAAQSVVTDVFVLTTQFNIHLIRPIFAEKITSVGTIISRTKSSIIAESVLLNSKGKTLATGRGTFALSKIQLTEEIGYH
ncbi:MAG: PaaI family thioesterase [Flavobacteriales bacterium]|nr:PaaI family thioesterase [Flavobacteriales bacterium]